jgi:hypothetical protein
LVSGLWSLVFLSLVFGLSFFGLWSLVFGLWSLVIDHWSWCLFSMPCLVIGTNSKFLSAIECNLLLKVEDISPPGPANEVNANAQNGMRTNRRKEHVIGRHLTADPLDNTKQLLFLSFLDTLVNTGEKGSCKNEKKNRRYTRCMPYDAMNIISRRLVSVPCISFPMLQR